MVEVDKDLVDSDLVQVNNNGKNFNGKNFFSNLSGSIFFELAIGIFSILSSISSVFVATFIGMTNLSVQNATLLLVLSLFILILLVIRLFNYLINNQKNSFLVCLTIFLLSLTIFVIKSLEFISLPLLIV